MEKAIQWFPGHMAKAYRIIKEKINLVDAIIEVVDARCPDASLNKNVREVIGQKPLLIVINKVDLGDKKEIEKWVKKLDENTHTIALNSLTGTKNIQEINKALEVVLKEKIEKSKQIGKNIYPLRAMIIGIPNVGKSTLLNNLAKRKAVEVGDRPGVTKNMQYIRVSDKLLLLDNPGTLWPKFEDDTKAKLLALIGSIKDEILPIKTVAMFGLDIIKEMYPESLKNRYNISSLELSNDEIFIEIGKKRGALIKGGDVDIDKVYDLFIRDFRSGKLGAMTFERVE